MLLKANAGSNFLDMQTKKGRITKKFGDN